MTSDVRVRRPSPTDVALGLAAGGVVVGENAVWAGSDFGLPVALLGPVAALVAGAAMLGRPVPHVAAMVAVIALMVIAAGPDGSTPFLISCAATMTLVAWRAGRDHAARRLTPLAFAAAAAGGVLAGLAMGKPEQALLSLVLTGVFALLPWMLGRHRAQQLALVAAATERVGRLEREREIVTEQTRLRERAQLAQEMHDSLGHELSLIALRAGALELDPQLAPRLRASIGQLRAGIGEATARLARIIDVLQDDAEPAPTALVDEMLTDLLDRARAAGMTVDLATSGPEPEPPVARAVHRVVQEALTNAAKHAPGTAVTVIVGSTPTDTVITVTNNRRAGDANTAVPHGSGRGLIGLTERVRLLRGDLTTSVSNHEFRLTARLPHTRVAKGRR